LSSNDFAALTREWLVSSVHQRYAYNFTWLGRPIIQTPQEMYAVQELIWSAKPTLIIETGIAHGGSLILSASMLALLDMADAIETGAIIDPASSKRKVIGVDIDIRAHNRAAIEAHPMASRIHMIEGSSVDPSIVAEVKAAAAAHERVLVLLDSMHTHQHVLDELEAYAPLVHVGGYCVVFDTFIEELPKGHFKNRPWDVGNNPKTALRAFLAAHPEFESDRVIEARLAINYCQEGFLKRLR
jgi:cephalosporin hydroxylase